jgi:hypothetical protein
MNRKGERKDIQECVGVWRHVDDVGLADKGMHLGLIHMRLCWRTYARHPLSNLKPLLRPPGRPPSTLLRRPSLSKIPKNFFIFYFIKHGFFFGRAGKGQTRIPPPLHQTSHPWSWRPTATTTRYWRFYSTEEPPYPCPMTSSKDFSIN